MSEVLELFLELAAVPSPPGEERAVADRVIRYLRDCGLEPDEDDAGASVGSTAGNVFTRLEPTAAGERVFLCAHFDTVPPTDIIEPVVEDGIVRNAKPTILGSDNKAAIAVMLEATRRILAENRTEVELEPEDDGSTRVELRSVQRLVGYSRFGGFLFRRATRRKLDAALDGLERAVEPV